MCAVVTTPRERHRPLSISIIADSAIVRFVLERHSPFLSSTIFSSTGFASSIMFEYLYKYSRQSVSQCSLQTATISHTNHSFTLFVHPLADSNTFCL
jgi:hypothetical protein